VKYRVHKFETGITEDPAKLEDFLNGLEGEVVEILPYYHMGPQTRKSDDFFLIVEKVG